MANLNHVLEEIDSLTPSERLKVMDRILMHLRAEHETANMAKNICLTGRAAVQGKRQVPHKAQVSEELSANPYDMKGLGA